MINENLKPIVLDIETSGLDFLRCGIWQIGAIDLNTGERFLEEAKIDEEDRVEEGALKITGETEEQLRNSKNQFQKQLLEEFFNWVDKRAIKTFLCQNLQFDLGFLMVKTSKYNLKGTFTKRSFDLHTIAQLKFNELNNKFSIEGNKSNMDLTNISKFCGIEDSRRLVRDNKISKEGKPHNALGDCKLTAECFSRLIYGKNLFPEFSKFEIPEALIK
jgi:DNA polymerase III epsilon subunit-like protein